VLLRRVPWKILVTSLHDENLEHLYQLAREKSVPLEIYPLNNYKACGLIRKLADACHENFICVRFGRDVDSLAQNPTRRRHLR
ncbi:MAG: hypothetical protein IKN27_05605, partial [Selenomonadaceae bacterium]|nr:hypothetical protein [Selenomonadaceae bacterium]